VNIYNKINIAHANGDLCVKIEDTKHGANRLSAWRKETKNPVISGKYGKRRMVVFLDNVWKRRK